MHTRTRTLIALLIVGLIGSGPAAHASILSLSSSPTLSGAYNQITVTPSTPFTFYVVAHDFSAAELAEGLFGFEFSVNFGDPGFSITSVGLINAPASFNVGTKDNLIVAAGSVVVLSNPTVLATFHAEYTGTPPTNHLVTLGPSTPSSFNPAAAGWLQPHGDLIPFSGLTSMTVNSTGVIPEPTTLALLGLGLAGAGIARRRKRKA